MVETMPLGAETCATGPTCETLAALYTMGSPIAVWGLRFADFGTPIEFPPKALTGPHPHADTEWVNIEPVIVCEVSFERLQSGRFRHSATFLRWRPDRDPHSCTFDQLDRPVVYDLTDIVPGLGSGPGLGLD